jgi:hypothetical protein
MTARLSQYPRTAGFALLLLASTACNDSPVPLPAPAEKTLHTVQVSPGDAVVLEDYAVQLDVVLRAADGTALPARPVVWTSGDTTIATVSETGFVRALRPGKVTITAAREGKTGTARLEVEPLRVTSITLSRSAVAIGFGQVVQVGATTGAQDGRHFPATVTWTSSNPAVASVDSLGRITGGLAGSASIKARVGDVVAELVAHSTGPAVAGDWLLSIGGLEDVGSVCTVSGVRLGLSVHGNTISGGTYLNTPSVTCILTAVGGVIAEPAAPRGANSGLLTGTFVHLQFHNVGWMLQGTFVTADRIEGNAYYTENGRMRNAQFVLSRN